MASLVSVLAHFVRIVSQRTFDNLSATFSAPLLCPFLSSELASVVPAESLKPDLSSLVLKDCFPHACCCIVPYAPFHLNLRVATIAYE